MTTKIKIRRKTKDKKVNKDYHAGHEYRIYLIACLLIVAIMTKVLDLSNKELLIINQIKVT